MDLSADLWSRFPEGFKQWTTHRTHQQSECFGRLEGLSLSRLLVDGRCGAEICNIRPVYAHGTKSVSRPTIAAAGTDVSSLVCQTRSSDSDIRKNGTSCWRMLYKKSERDVSANSSHQQPLVMKYRHDWFRLGLGSRSYKCNIKRRILK